MLIERRRVVADNRWSPNTIRDKKSKPTLINSDEQIEIPEQVACLNMFLLLRRERMSINKVPISSTQDVVSKNSKRNKNFNINRTIIDQQISRLLFFLSGDEQIP